MAAFRFRAAAALAARQKDEDAASLVFATRDGLRINGEARHHDAIYLNERAALSALEASRAGLGDAARGWHRNWIETTASAATALGHEASRLADDATQAKRAWEGTRRRRLALERLRDRAWRRFQTAEQKREMKAIDELAQVRHQAAAAEQGRLRHGD